MGGKPGSEVFFELASVSDGWSPQRWGTHWVSPGVLCVQVYGGWKKGREGWAARAQGGAGSGEAGAHPLGQWFPPYPACSPFQWGDCSCEKDVSTKPSSSAGLGAGKGQGLVMGQKQPSLLPPLISANDKHILTPLP